MSSPSSKEHCPTAGSHTQGHGLCSVSAQGCAQPHRCEESCVRLHLLQLGCHVSVSRQRSISRQASPGCIRVPHSHVAGGQADAGLVEAGVRLQTYLAMGTRNEQGLFLVRLTTSERHKNMHRSASQLSARHGRDHSQSDCERGNRGACALVIVHRMTTGHQGCFMAMTP